MRYIYPKDLDTKGKFTIEIILNVDGIAKTMLLFCCHCCCLVQRKRSENGTEFGDGLDDEWTVVESLLNAGLYQT